MTKDSVSALTVVNIRVQVMVFLLYGLSISTAIGFAIWAIVNRKSQVVRASQPLFLYMIIFGALLFSSAMIPPVIQAKNSIACNATVWLYSIGCSVTLSALEAKLFRINKIMRSSKRFIRVKVTVYDTLKHMFILVGLNALILVLMAIISPVKYVVPDEVISLNGETIQRPGFCNYGDSLQFIIPLIVLNVITILLMTIQTYLARNITTELSEAKYIFIVLVLMDAVTLLGVPVLFLAGGPLFVNIRVYVVSAMNFVVCNSTLYSMFVPKILFAIENKNATSVSMVHLGAIHNTDNNNGDGAEVFSSTTGRTNNLVDAHDGDRILHRRSRIQLIQENLLLRCRIQAMAESVAISRPQAKEQNNFVSGVTNILPSAKEGPRDGDTAVEGHDEH